MITYRKDMIFEKNVYFDTFEVYCYFKIFHTIIKTKKKAANFFHIHLSLILYRLTNCS